MNITFQGRSINVKRGIAGYALISHSDEGAEQLFESLDAVSKAGYDALEMRIPMVLSYLDSDHTTEEIKKKLQAVGIEPALLTCLEPLESVVGPEGKEFSALCRRVFEAARDIGCRHVQAIARDQYPDSSWDSVRKHTVLALREVASIASEYDVSIAFEPCATYPVGNLEQGLEVFASIWNI